MISKKTKLFFIDGNGYRFDSNSFNSYFKNYAKQNSIKYGELEEKIADELFVTKEAIHNWRFACNGPASKEIIQKLASSISLSDYMNLLKKDVESNEMDEYSTLQIESMKRIYDAIIEFLEDFYNTDGFTGTLWYEFIRKGSSNPEIDIEEYAENRIKVVSLVLTKEYFYLHDTKVYAELSDYIDNDLWETFSGKLGYAYRFEATGENEPTTLQDYNKALKRINEIIEQYV